MASPASVPHTRILAGLVLGAAAGCLVNYLFVGVGADQRPVVPQWLRLLNQNVTEPIGQVFLRLLFVTVVPLVFASLAVGVAQIGSVGAVGRVGGKTIAYFLVITTIATVIGLVLVNAVKPGEGLPPGDLAELQKQFATGAGERKPAEYTVMSFVQSVVPNNPFRAAANLEMLGIITFALLVGVGLTKLDAHKAEPVVRLLEAIGELMVFIITLAMKLAPVGVFCLIFATTSQLGFALLGLLGKYVFVVLLGLAIQGGLVLPALVRVLGGYGPLTFFRKARASIVTAFSTSSSNATLPTNLRTAEVEFGVPPRIAAFVLPLGATMCMAGTALFEGVTVMFLAQLMLPEPMALGQQALVVMLCVLTAVGAAGVPGGSIPLLMLVLETAGIPPGAIAIVLGIDRILDMCRTTVNNIGDLSAVVVVARSEAGHAASVPPAP
ncbi:dicarboxylate/amino acid:cation symporter [Urbifossiella limnaea]|uniref:Proton glutamate symport protein n=1 Tax=Urbifossiella limnaea TaxID=2528023 RepID=A0A517XXS7_9BACT|nr:dicarboxylate/amino acid:cation symporter [Urbifossiella limnaea]QDU22301.1 Proton glutamate symport protein [Urbifossiella limnaea]